LPQSVDSEHFTITTQTQAKQGKIRHFRRKNLMTKILFICHGNICRSTMAHFVFQDLVNKADLTDSFFIDSKATSTDALGESTHYGTVKKLREVGVPVLPHTSTQITKADYRKFDYIIAMDTNNIRSLDRILKGDPQNKISKLLSFAGKPGDIADPWYTGDFDATYRDVLEGCTGLLNELISH